MAPLPGWHSLESVSSIHRTLEIAGIVCLGLLVLAEILAYLYGHRRDELAAERAQQQGIAAKAEHEGQVAELSAKLAKSERAAKESVAKAEQATRKALDVEAKQAPRRLTATQRAALVELLSPHRGQAVSVACIMGDIEGKTFAEDFVSALRQSGWLFEGEPGVGQAVYDKDPVGVEVTINESEARGNRVPTAAMALVDALKKTNVLSGNAIFVNPKTPPNLIELRIGKKPAAGH